MKIIIGTRRSDLACIQGELVGEALTRAYPDIEIEYFHKASEGDLDQKTPLWQLPDRGVFTQDLSALLLSGKVDVVVHSWKDCPEVAASGTEIVGTLKREDLRDMLLVRKDRWKKICDKKSISVLTSSPRREYNLSSFLTWALPTEINEVKFSSVRGNIQTRINKLLSGEDDALVVAKAAISRLLMANPDRYQSAVSELRRTFDQCYWMILPLTSSPVAAAQAALAIEVNQSRSDLKSLFTAITDEESMECVQQEREILKNYGGGCHQKIGVSVITFPFGRVTFLRGETEEGKILDSVSLKADTPYPPQTDYLHIWPKEESQALFSTEDISVKQPEGRCIYWIAKERALPQSWEVAFDDVVWCAGLKTWYKLAKRGVWINGSSESLGEDKLDLYPLIEDSLPCYKLSHADAHCASDKSLIASYKLNLVKPVKITQETHFYWSSIAAFKAVLQSNPDIINAWHACGAGNTYKYLSEALPDKNRLSVWLNYDAWKEYVLLK